MDTAPADARAAFHAHMPAMRDHEGLWRGTYRHITVDAETEDIHASEVLCEFPTDGPSHYIQHNTFTWPDERQQTATLPGVFKDGRLWFDTPTFFGSAWEARDGIILLNLTRRDEPGASFREIILMGAGGRHRSRTWHWFRDGSLYRRTLCEESRVSPDATPDI